MNQTIKRVNQEKILFMDIEDVRRNKELDINSREYELYEKKTRNRDTDEYLPSEEVISQYKKKAALKMCYTKIVTIGVGFIKNEEVHIKALEGTEEEIIKQFCLIAQNFDYMCFSNGIAFDLPMVINNGYRYFDVCEFLPDRFITSGKKIWNLDKLLDLQEIFKGTHYIPSSLDEMCYHFDLPSPKQDLDGSMVSDEYWDNGVEKIVGYVKQDVFSCINLFKKMRFEQPFETFIDKTDIVVEEKPLLEKLYTSGAFTKDIKEQVEEMIKDATQEDKENIKKILLANYQQKGDKVAIKKQKEKEISDFLNNLK